MMTAVSTEQYVSHSQDAKRLYRDTGVNGPLTDVTQETVPAGAILTEYDTGKRFVYDKSLDAWQPITEVQTGAVETNKLLERLLEQVQLLAEGLLR